MFSSVALTIRGRDYAKRQRRATQVFQIWTWRRTPLQDTPSPVNSSRGFKRWVNYCGEFSPCLSVGFLLPRQPRTPDVKAALGAAAGGLFCNGRHIGNLVRISTVSFPRCKILTYMGTLRELVIWFDLPFFSVLEKPARRSNRRKIFQKVHTSTIWWSMQRKPWVAETFD